MYQLADVKTPQKKLESNSAGFREYQICTKQIMKKIRDENASSWNHDEDPLSEGIKKKKKSKKECHSESSKMWANW